MFTDEEHTREAVSALAECASLTMETQIMATKTTRGWEWTPRERESIKVWQGQVRTNSARMGEQVRRFKDAVPQFAGEAATLADPVLQLADQLLTLDGRRHGRKYQQLSPEEANQKLGLIAASQELWRAFTTRDEVVAAIREANRGINQRRREFVKMLDEAKRKLLQQLDSDAYREQLEKEVDVLLDCAKVSAALARRESGPSADDLRRYLLVQVINSTRFFMPSNGAELVAFCSGDARAFLS